MNPVRRALKPGLRYGAIAFLIGGVLGPLRELVLAPLLGGVPAAVIEAAVIAPALWLVARATTRPLVGLPGWQPGIAMVLIALFVLLLAEAAFAGVLTATGLGAARPERGEAERIIGQALMLWLVAAPFIALRRR